MTEEKVKTTEEKAKTAEELLLLITAAGTAGDIAEVIRLGNLLKKLKGEVEKAETDKLLREAEALSGSREALEKRLRELVLPQIRAAELLAVKVKSFIVTVAHKENEKGAIDPNGSVDVKSGLALVIPPIKAKKSGGGGTGVSTKDETGLNLAELIEVHGTADQKAAIQKAYDDAVKNKNSARWRAQQKVKTEILKAHPELLKV